MELNRLTPPPPAMAIRGSASAASRLFFIGFEMHAGERADDLQMTQLFGADIHQQIFALRVIAVQALNGILHGGSKFAVGAAELLQQHVAESRDRARRREPYT